MKILNIIIVAFLFVCCTSCWKISDDDCWVDYAFDFPIQVTPKDTFHIGDTIWYSMDIPNQLTNNFDGEKVDITDFELFYEFGLQRRDSFLNGHAPFDDFDYIAETGKVVNQVYTFQTKEFYFESTQDKRFKIGLIPKVSDVYVSQIFLPSLYMEREPDNDGNNHNIATEECVEAFTHYDNYPVNNGRNNHHLIAGRTQNTLSSGVVPYPDKSEFDRMAAFAFVVIP